MKIQDVVAFHEERVGPAVFSSTDDVPDLPSANDRGKQQRMVQRLVNPPPSPGTMLPQMIRPTLAAKRGSLAELTRPETTMDAGDLLQDAGYKQIGPQGNFATAFTKANSPYVLKLFTPSDLAYRKFMELTYTHPSKHYPIFRGQPVKVNNNYWGIRVERLRHLGGKWYPSIIKCRTFLEAFANLRRLAQHEAEGISRTTEIQKYQDFIARFAKANPSVAEAIANIDKYIIATKPDLYMQDINMYNAGLRADGTLVFFDPLGTAAHSGMPDILPSEMDEGLDLSRDEINRIAHDRMSRIDRRIRQKKAVAMPGNTSTYPAL